MYEQHIFLEDNRRSNDTLVKSVKYKIGGSAFNTAYGLSKMGHKVKLICSIGKDIEGEYIKSVLSKMSQINTDYVNFSNHETSSELQVHMVSFLLFDLLPNHNKISNFFQS